ARSRWTGRFTSCTARSGTRSRPRCSRATSRARASEPEGVLIGAGTCAAALICDVAPLHSRPRGKAIAPQSIGEETLMNRLILGLSLAGGFALATATGAAAGEYFELSSPALQERTPMAPKNARGHKTNPELRGPDRAASAGLIHPAGRHQKLCAPDDRPGRPRRPRSHSLARLQHSCQRDELRRRRDQPAVAEVHWRQGHCGPGDLHGP